jgi:hypothetical protein
MNVVYDVNGSQIAAIKEYDIATGTAITIGQVTKLVAGKVVPVVVGETSPVLGVSTENHPGTADTLNPRSIGLRIKILDGPQSILECPAPQATATSGSTTTLVVTGLGGVFVDGDFIGGKMKLVTKGATSTITDPINTVYPITGSTAATGTFTTTQVITGGVTAGDIFAIFPPVQFQKGNFDATFQKVILTATAALPLRVASCSETDRLIVQYEYVLHIHGNKNS